MGWWIALGVLGLLAILPLGVSALYDAAGFRVFIVAGPVKIKAYPGKKKQKEKKQTPKEEKKSAKKTAQKASVEKNRGGSVEDFRSIVELILDFLAHFRRKLRLNRVELNLVLAGDDPCDLATNYGRAWAALGNLWPRLEERYVIKKRDVQVQCDFTADQTVVTARLDMSITLGRLVVMSAIYGTRGIRELLKYNKRKGGAKL